MAQIEKCGILIIGAGPAGSSAARAAANRGADVLMIDRRKQVGVPVQCAEYIPAPLIGDVNLGRAFVVQPVKGMRTHLPSGECKEMRQPGYIIHRDLFDQALAQDAVQKGARLRLLHTAIALRDGTVLVRNHNGSEYQIRPDIIIGADGPKSIVAGWIGEKAREPISGIQAQVALPVPLAYTDVYFNPDWFGGYGWLFPKGKTANVGLAARKDNGKSPQLKILLVRFINRLIADGRIAGEPRSFASGLIPAQPAKKIIHKNIAIVGDAAGHTHPITGAGIFSAIAGGGMAGKAAAEAALSGSPELLSAYASDFSDMFSQSLDRAVNKRCFMEKEWENLDGIIKSCWVAFREYYET